jgi:hypothetical protein
MPHSQVPIIKLERLPHRHAIIRLRQAYRHLGQVVLKPETDLEKTKSTVQEGIKCQK